MSNKNTTEKLEKAQIAYAEKFGEGFPMFQLATNRSDDEIIAIIEECVKSGKNVYERGIVKNGENVLY